MYLLYKYLKLAAVFFLLLPFSLKSKSQGNRTDTLTGRRTDTTNEKKPLPPPVRKPQTKILGVYKDGHANEIGSSKAGIGDIIVIRVQNPATLQNKAQCKTTEGQDSAGCNPQQISLFINGRVIKKITPLSGALQIDSTGQYGELQYRLERNADNDDAWTDLLGSPKIGGGKFFIHPVTVSVGLENSYAIPAQAENFTLVRIRKPWFVLCFICVGIYLFLLVRLARKRGLLRDRGINLRVLGITPDNSKLTYSLARFQMAFWFTLVISSFLFIWLITGSYNIITDSVLALIGISAATSLSAAVIDNNKAEEILKKTIDLKTERENLKNDILDLEKLLSANPPQADIIQLTSDRNTKKARLLQVEPEIDKNIQALTPPASEGFFNDILSDANGISFHRLQMFVWTLVLGLIFVFSVWVRLSMPEFETALLALQGLTAGTYLGFKIPEKQT